MYARTIHLRAALLAFIALGVIVGYSPTRASAATSFACPQNLYSSCFEQPSVQVLQVTALKKSRHKITKKKSYAQCPPPYIGLRCR